MAAASVGVAMPKKIVPRTATTMTSAAQGAQSLATGAVSLGLAATIPTSLVGQRFPELSLPATLAFEHPTGELRVKVEKAMGDNSPTVSVMRTTRRLFEGAALVRKDA